MSGIGVLLGLTGLVIHLAAGAAAISGRVRMALPLPVRSSPVVLTILGLVCEVVGGLMIVL